VNRLHPGKDFGCIIDYFGVITQLHEALELYSALEGKFDKEDLEGTLTDVAEELKRLPEMHDALWDLFRDVKNKKDEEAFELALEQPERRDEFYAKLSKFCRVLKTALASIHWIRQTPAATADAYKRDAFFFQKLRASVKIRYAEEVDYREYEAQIQKMLTTYVQADEVVQVVEPVNIFERSAFEKEVDKARSPRAKADIIANRTKKTITEKMEDDPFFYRRFSVLLEQTIADYKAQRISEAQYLAKVRHIMEAVRDGRTSDAPSVLRNRDLSRAFYGALKDQLVELAPTEDSSNSIAREDSPPYGGSSAQSRGEDLLASAACQIEDIIRRHAVVRWRENPDAQNRMRNDLDDFLFALQDEKGIKLSLPQMDVIIESALRIARNRTNDV
jgi:type I restriction enzyme R subunit